MTQPDIRLDDQAELELRARVTSLEQALTDTNLTVRVIAIVLAAVVLLLTLKLRKAAG